MFKQPYILKLDENQHIKVGLGEWGGWQVLEEHRPNYLLRMLLKKYCPETYREKVCSALSFYQAYIKSKGGNVCGCVCLKNVFTITLGQKKMLRRIHSRSPSTASYGPPLRISATVHLYIMAE